MESIFKDDSIPRLSDAELFTRIWNEPRKVFRFVHDQRYNKWTHPILITVALMPVLLINLALYFNGDFSAYVLGVMLITGLAGTYLVSGLFALLLNFANTTFFKATDSSTGAMLRIIAYARIPGLYASFAIRLVVLLVNTIHSGRVFGNPDLPYYTGQTMMYLEQGFRVWSLVLMVLGMTETQHLSTGKAVIAVLIPVVFIYVPLDLLTTSLINRINH